MTVNREGEAGTLTIRFIGLTGNMTAPPSYVWSDALAASLVAPLLRYNNELHRIRRGLPWIECVATNVTVLAGLSATNVMIAKAWASITNTHLTATWQSAAPIVRHGGDHRQLLQKRAKQVSKRRFPQP